jgi:hypothetical protein
MSNVIEQAVEARLVATTPHVPAIYATLRYDSTDPFAVRMTFPAPATLEGVEVCWTFARDLLADGMEEEAGEGDVQVGPHGPEHVVLSFHAPEGTALVHVRSHDLRRFLRRSSALVAYGDEGRYIDLDRDLVELMRDAC